MEASHTSNNKTSSRYFHIFDKLRNTRCA
jgi:hypothetical protein